MVCPQLNNRLGFINPGLTLWCMWQLRVNLPGRLKCSHVLPYAAGLLRRPAQERNWGRPGEEGTGDENPWRIHGAAIYGVPWIPSTETPVMLALIYSTMDPMGNDNYPTSIIMRSQQISKEFQSPLAFFWGSVSLFGIFDYSLLFLLAGVMPLLRPVGFITNHFATSSNWMPGICFFPKSRSILDGYKLILTSLLVSMGISTCPSNEFNFYQCVFFPKHLFEWLHMIAIQSHRMTGICWDIMNNYHFPSVV